MKLAKFSAIFAALLSVSAAAAAPEKVVFDTDMGNDVDDALALAMLHRYQMQGRAEIAAVLVNKGAPEAPAFCALQNEYYGGGSIPVGHMRGGKTPDPGAFAGKVAAAQNPDGSPKYALPECARGGKFPDAVKLARKALAESEDGSVVYISVGFLTNAARLLESPPDEISPLSGAELAAKKIKFFSVMGGDFSDPGYAEYNIKEDVGSAQVFTKLCPSKIYFSGFEVGRGLRFPQGELDRRMRPDNPVNEAYKLYAKMVNRGKSDRHDRPSWDLTSVLFVFEPELFGISESGNVSFDGKGRTKFTPAEGGKSAYLKIPGDGGKKILERLAQTAAYEPRN